MDKVIYIEKKDLEQMRKRVDLMFNMPEPTHYRGGLIKVMEIENNGSDAS